MNVYRKGKKMIIHNDETLEEFLDNDKQYGGFKLDNDCNFVDTKAKPWRAEKREKFWFVSDIGWATPQVDIRGRIDDDMYAIGTYFQTKELCKASNKYSVMNDPKS